MHHTFRTRRYIQDFSDAFPHHRPIVIDRVEGEEHLPDAFAFFPVRNAVEGYRRRFDLQIIV